MVISKNTDERFLFRFKNFILEIEDIEKNEERMSCKELAHIRHWLLQSAESIQGLEVMHTVFLPDWTLKNGHSLILPSSIARNS